MGDQEKLIQFVTWLGENIPELKGKAPEEIVETVNKLSSSEEGQQMLQGLIKEFESNTTGMFKKGGKLGYLLCLKSGGSIQDCGCGCKKIRKGQDGIPEVNETTSPKYTRREAINAGRSMGLTRQQSRNAYNNMMYQTMKDGISAKDARRITRNNMIQSAGQSARRNLEKATTQSTPQLNQVDLTSLNDNYQIKDVAPNVDNYNIDNLEIETSIPTPDRFGGSFDNAFGMGRKLGLDKFYYNGPDKKAGWYTTELDTNSTNSNNGGFVSGVREQNQQRSSVNQDVVSTAVNDAISAPKWYQKLGKAFRAGVIANNAGVGILQKGGIINEEILPINSEQYPYASKQDAFDAAKQVLIPTVSDGNVTNRDARLAYRDSKRFMKRQGLRGNDMRQAARYHLIDMAYPRAGMTEEERMNNLLNNFTTKISYN